MSFRLVVKEIICIERLNVWIIEGVLNEGDIKHGSVGKVVGLSGRNNILFKNIILTNAKNVGTGFITMAIEKPEFPIEFLKEGTIIEGE